MTAARCARTVYWFDVEITVRCVRPHGHAGLHRDGTRWFDDAGFQKPSELGKARPTRLTASSGGWQRLTDAEVRDIRRRHAAGETYALISRLLGIDYATVRSCARGETYRSVA